MLSRSQSEESMSTCVSRQGWLHVVIQYLWKF